LAFTNFLPHPCPLPLGEGETLPASYENLRLDWRSTYSKRRKLAWLFPLPAGEGQGEGERMIATNATTYFKMFETYVYKTKKPESFDSGFL
jgi:hypothetical protein